MGIRNTRRGFCCFGMLCCEVGNSTRPDVSKHPGDLTLEDESDNIPQDNSPHISEVREHQVCVRVCVCVCVCVYINQKWARIDRPV